MRSAGDALGDLTIGRRLAVGLTLVLALLLVIAALVATSHGRAVRAQHAYDDRIEPLRRAADELEQRVLSLALATRAALLRPVAAQQQRFDLAAAEVLSALRTLDGMPMQADGEKLFGQVDVHVADYVERARQSVEHSAAAPLDLPQEIALAEAREAAAEAVHAFSALQREKAERAIAAIEEARAQLAVGLGVSGVLGVLAYLAFALWTAAAIRGPLVRLAGVTQAIERGDWAPALRLREEQRGAEPPRSELRRLARALGEAAWQLDRRERRLRADARLAVAAASKLERSSIGHRALDVIVEQVGAEIAVLYLWNEDSGMLEPAASRALAQAPEPMPLGSGIPGEAARRGQRLVLEDLPHEAGFELRLGYDRSLPRMVVAQPILFRDALRGVLVVASLRKLDDDALDFLDGATRQLGMALQNVYAYERVQQLLAEVRESHERIQAQNEELQAQAEEIQAQNEELQSQNEELQAQQEELQAQTDELQTHRAELLDRTEALQTQRDALRRQGELLRESDVRKNQFLGVLAHELRNPIAPISSSLFVLQRAEVGSEQARRALQVVERQTHHLARLVEDLFDITRISQGKVRLQPARIDLVGVVRDCIEDSEAAAESAGVELLTELPQGAVWIEGDRVRLCQVVGNLLGNALKFTPQGGRIWLRMHPGPDDQVTIRVADSGAGIPAALLPCLFEPFRQGLDTQQPHQNPGLGLGLSLVKAFVQLHGGTVEAHSAGEGQGAEFIVRLPAQGFVAPAPPEFQAGEGLRILVIDDNVDAAQSLSEVLALEGYEVRTAYSGGEGLEIAAQFHPRVVLCDIGMPGMDGYETVRCLREQHAAERLLLVAVSGYGAAHDLERMRAAGFDEHLGKPLVFEQLFALLAHCAPAKTDYRNQGNPKQ